MFEEDNDSTDTTAYTIWSVCHIKRSLTSRKPDQGFGQAVDVFV